MGILPTSLVKYHGEILGCVGASGVRLGVWGKGGGQSKVEITATIPTVTVIEILKKAKEKSALYSGRRIPILSLLLFLTSKNT
jgi:hypothetical protein